MLPAGEGEGDGSPLQYPFLESPTDGGAWWAAVHGVAKSRIRLSGFTFTFNFHALQKEMATHSSVLAWTIPGMGEPGGLPSMGSHRVRFNTVYDISVYYLLNILDLSQKSNLCLPSKFHEIREFYLSFSPFILFSPLWCLE